MRLRLTFGDRGSPASRAGEGPVGPERAEERRPRCPRCGTPIRWAGNLARPFCSVTCKLIDLGDWLDERYRMPGPSLGGASGEPEAPPEEPSDRR